MNEYEIWIEGYAATGEYEKARQIIGDAPMYKSKWKGVTFEQACVKALNELKWPMLYEALQGLGSCYYDPKNNSYWARRFYDNEADARKFVG